MKRSLTALAVFAIAGKNGVAIDLVRQHVKFTHTLTRFAIPYRLGRARDAMNSEVSTPPALSPRPQRGLRAPVGETAAASQDSGHVEHGLLGQPLALLGDEAAPERRG